MNALLRLTFVYSGARFLFSHSTRSILNYLMIAYSIGAHIVGPKVTSSLNVSGP